MKETWSILMLIGGALFMAGVIPIAWERADAWRELDSETFRNELAYTLRRVDKLQPALLLVTLAASIAFAVAAGGTPRALAGIAAVCFAAILIGSGLALVPIQRRLTDPTTSFSDSEIAELRTCWLRRHLGRTLLAVAAYTLLVIAAIV